MGRRGWRRGVGEPVGARPARLAHRVQRDGHGTCSASNSIFIAAAWTTFSRITKRRSRRAEGCTGKKFVRYWLHCAHLMVDGQKMSKSFGNFYTLRDLLAKGYTGREVRYALLRVHYRAPLNFTWEGMEEARQALAPDRRMVAPAPGSGPRRKLRRPNRRRPTIEDDESSAAALDDDLNISAALGHLFETDPREQSRARRRDRLGARAVLAAMVGTNQPRPRARRRKRRSRPRRSRTWRRSGCRRGLPRTGKKVMNCATHSQARGWDVRDTKDGQVVTRARAGRPNDMFIAGRILRPRAHRAFEAVRDGQIRLGRAQTDPELPAVPAQAGGARRAGRQAVHQRLGLHRAAARSSSRARC